MNHKPSENWRENIDDHIFKVFMEEDGWITMRAWHGPVTLEDIKKFTLSLLAEQKARVVEIVKGMLGDNVEYLPREVIEATISKITSEL